MGLAWVGDEEGMAEAEAVTDGNEKDADEGEEKDEGEEEENDGQEVDPEVGPETDNADVD